MMISFADRLSAKTGSKVKFAELFAAIGIDAKEGEKVPLFRIDEAIKDLEIEERLVIKSGLRQAGLI